MGQKSEVSVKVCWLKEKQRVHTTVRKAEEMSFEACSFTRFFFLTFIPVHIVSLGCSNRTAMQYKFYKTRMSSFFMEFE